MKKQDIKKILGIVLIGAIILSIFLLTGKASDEVKLAGIKKESSTNLTDSKKEVVKTDLQIKKESLKEFSRVKSGDSDVVEEVVEVLKSEKVLELEQGIKDDLAEIARRQAHLEGLQAELAKYK